MNRRSTPLLLAVAALGVACSGGVGPDATTTTAPTAEEKVRSDDGAIQATEGDGATVLSRFSGTRWFAGDVPAPRPADAAAAPVVVGLLAEPGTSLSEAHPVTRAAAAFVNAELGGIGGRPLQVETCRATDTTPAAAEACVRKLLELGVTAVIGTATALPGSALDALGDASVPLVGATAMGDATLTSPASVQFDGGLPGLFDAAAIHAVERSGAERVTLLVDQRADLTGAAVREATRTARTLEVPIGDPAPLPPAPSEGEPEGDDAVRRAVAELFAGRPEAVVVGIDRSRCAELLPILADEMGRTHVYLPGWCAEARLLDRLPSARFDRLHFGIGHRLDQRADDRADTEIGAYVLERYGDRKASITATPWLRAVLNLWHVSGGLAGAPSGPSFLEALRTYEGPSFDGHDVNCPSPPLRNLPAACAPQQVLVRFEPTTGFREASDGWIEEPATRRSAP